MLLLEELGRAAVPGPVFETAAVVAPALGDGATVGTAVLDGSPYVPHAHVASFVLVPGGVSAPTVRRLTAVDAIDGGRRLFTVDGRGRAVRRTTRRWRSTAARSRRPRTSSG